MVDVVGPTQAGVGHVGVEPVGDLFGAPVAGVDAGGGEGVADRSDVVASGFVQAVRAGNELGGESLLGERPRRAARSPLRGRSAGVSWWFGDGGIHTYARARGCARVW